MLKRDTLLKRFRNLGEAKSYERIQTSTGCETLTHTQAYRFRELQSTRSDGKGSRRNSKSHYSLKEAARLLKSTDEDILLSAAAGRLQCFVMSEGLWGHWLATGDGEPFVPTEPAAMPKYLALSPADCQQIATFGSVNVYDLEYPADPVPDGGAISTSARFILREPLWVDRKRIVLAHPLPK